MQKLKTLIRERHDEIWELVRYIVAGALTFLLSYVLSNLCYILLAHDHTIEGANGAQLAIGNAISWVAAVIFAFWINRRIVFRYKHNTRKESLVAFIQFTGARAISLVLFEIGLAYMLKEWVGVSNYINRPLVLVLVILFNYIVSKFWIFKKEQPTQEEP